MFGALGNLLGGGQTQGFEDFMKMIREGMGKSEQTVGSANKILDPLSQMALQQLPLYLRQTQEMADPKAFMAKLMGDYTEGPEAKFAKDQAMAAMEAAGRTSGASGSTNYLNQIGKTSADISNMYRQQHLQNLLGIKQGALSGQKDVLGMTMPGIFGQSSNLMSLAQLYPQFYSQLGAGAMGKAQSESNDLMNMLGLGAKIFGMASGFPIF